MLAREANSGMPTERLSSGASVFETQHNRIAVNMISYDSQSIYVSELPTIIRINSTSAKEHSYITSSCIRCTNHNSVAKDARKWSYERKKSALVQLIGNGGPEEQGHSRKNIRRNGEVVCSRLVHTSTT